MHRDPRVSGTFNWGSAPLERLKTTSMQLCQLTPVILFYLMLQFDYVAKAMIRMFFKHLFSC